MILKAKSHAKKNLSTDRMLLSNVTYPDNDKQQT